MISNCVVAVDHEHCDCWYDGDRCCRCGASEMTTAEKVEQGMVTLIVVPVFTHCLNTWSAVHRCRKMYPHDGPCRCRCKARRRA